MNVLSVKRGNNVFGQNIKFKVFIDAKQIFDLGINEEKTHNLDDKEKHVLQLKHSYGRSKRIPVNFEGNTELKFDCNITNSFLKLWFMGFSLFFGGSVIDVENVSDKT